MQSKADPRAEFMVNYLPDELIGLNSFVVLGSLLTSDLSIVSKRISIFQFFLFWSQYFSLRQLMKTRNRRFIQFLLIFRWPLQCPVHWKFQFEITINAQVAWSFYNRVSNDCNTRGPSVHGISGRGLDEWGHMTRNKIGFVWNTGWNNHCLV